MLDSNLYKQCAIGVNVSQCELNLRRGYTTFRIPRGISLPGDYIGITMLEKDVAVSPTL